MVIVMFGLWDFKSCLLAEQRPKNAQRTPRLSVLIPHDGRGVGCVRHELREENEKKKKGKRKIREVDRMV